MPVDWQPPEVYEPTRPEAELRIAELPWLDAANDDDRILAAFVEVMRLHPRTPVIW